MGATVGNRALDAKNRPVGAHWIAIDDMPHWFKEDCPNLLVTDPKHGFTKENQEQLRQMIRERMP
jgi:hypothetical protein